MRLIKNLTMILGLLLGLALSFPAQAENWCWVKNETDNSTTIQGYCNGTNFENHYDCSLRAQVALLSTNECAMPQSLQDIKVEPTVFKNLIVFDTAEIEFTDNLIGDATVKKIVLNEPLTFNAKATTVIGNWSRDAIDDPETKSLYESIDRTRYDNAYGNGCMWNADDKKNSLPRDMDCGYVVLDMRENFDSKDSDDPALNLPIKCKAGSADIYFRNMVFVTNGYSKSDLFGGLDETSCFKDGGDTHVCNGQYKDTDPNGSETWCQGLLTHLPDRFNSVLNQLFSSLADRDGDGFKKSDDCDDNDANINPNATEVCDGVDNDCDGEVDEDLATTYFADADGDGYGDSDNTTSACSLPSGYVTNDKDCDDTNADVNPDASEDYTNEVDDDCDGTVDDEDGDSYTITSGGDCDDQDATVNPGATEDPENGVDDNCDGNIDEAAQEPTDNDGDGFLSDEDCDDNDAQIHPDAEEVCDFVDNNCDGNIDEDDICALTDFDEDGFTADVDCDDEDPTVNPDALEICSNGVDDNCDGEVDEEDTCTQSVNPATGSSGCGCNIYATKAGGQSHVILSFLIAAFAFILVGLRERAHE